MKTYSEKLKDPRWQRKRLEIMERDGFACRYCRSTENTLNVHHRIYRKGKMPWDYEDEVFVTLCQPCHQHAEERKESVLMTMGSNPYHDRDLANISMALSQNPVDLTYLGWTLSSLAGCINAQMSIMADAISTELGVTPDDGVMRDNMHEEFKNNMFDAIEHLHSALFDLRQKFPES